MTTMSIPWGRYRWARLAFGISSASEWWQQRTHAVLEGLHIISIAYEILVPGCGSTEAEARIDHEQRLIAVLEHFEKHHVKINVNKMEFLVREATFMGHLITAEGRQPNPAIVQAILKMPTPTDKAGFRRVLGAMNYSTSANSARSLAALRIPSEISQRKTQPFYGQHNTSKLLM